MNLGSTQPVIELCTGNPGGKGWQPLPSVSGFSRKCWSLAVSLIFGPTRPATETALLFLPFIHKGSNSIQNKNNGIEQQERYVDKEKTE
jgi:hypothetical protein